MISTLVRVDRSAKPFYPIWVCELVYPHYEHSGPERFDVSAVELWLHSAQQNGRVLGQELYEHIVHEGILESCLNLADGYAIQQLGVEIYRRFFGTKKVFLWKSAVKSIDEGKIRIPLLMEDPWENWGRGKVQILWHSLTTDFDQNYPAARMT